MAEFFIFLLFGFIISIVLIFVIASIGPSVQFISVLGDLNSAVPLLIALRYVLMFGGLILMIVLGIKLFIRVKGD